MNFPGMNDNYCGLNGSLGQMYYVQRGLAVGQCIPPYGPIIISPIKAFVSIAQTIVGFVGALFCKIKSLYKGDITLALQSVTYLKHALMGTVGLIYSFINFKTFGFVGLNIEVFFDPSASKLF